MSRDEMAAMGFASVDELNGFMDRVEKEIVGTEADDEYVCDCTECAA